MTQIMNLLNLAPDIQEEILFPDEAPARRALVYERQVRPITKLVEWEQQRRVWREVGVVA
jgi:hypothetical protein